MCSVSSFSSVHQTSCCQKVTPTCSAKTAVQVSHVHQQVILPMPQQLEQSSHHLLLIVILGGFLCHTASSCSSKVIINTCGRHGTRSDTAWYLVGVMQCLTAAAEACNLLSPWGDDQHSLSNAPGIRLRPLRPAASLSSRASSAMRAAASCSS